MLKQKKYLFDNSLYRAIFSLILFFILFLFFFFTFQQFYSRYIKKNSIKLKKIYSTNEKNKEPLFSNNEKKIDQEKSLSTRSIKNILQDTITLEDTLSQMEYEDFFEKNFGKEEQRKSKPVIKKATKNIVFKEKKTLTKKLLKKEIPLAETKRNSKKKEKSIESEKKINLIEKKLLLPNLNFWKQEDNLFSHNRGKYHLNSKKEDSRQTNQKENVIEETKELAPIIDISIEEQEEQNELEDYLIRLKKNINQFPGKKQSTTVILKTEKHTVQEIIFVERIKSIAYHMYLLDLLKKIKIPQKLWYKEIHLFI